MPGTARRKKTNQGRLRDSVPLNPNGTRRRYEAVCIEHPNAISQENEYCTFDGNTSWITDTTEGILIVNKPECRDTKLLRNAKLAEEDSAGANIQPACSHSIC